MSPKPFDAPGSYCVGIFRDDTHHFARLYAAFDAWLAYQELPGEERVTCFLGVRGVFFRVAQHYASTLPPDYAGGIKLEKIRAFVDGHPEILNGDAHEDQKTS